MLPNRFVLFSLAFLTTGSFVLPGQTLFRKPVKVLGDPNYIGTAASPTLYDGNGPNVVEGRELSAPVAIALDTSVSPPIVYISDAGNNRVLGYQYGTQLKPGAMADVILGQTDRFANLPLGPGTARSTGMNQPTGIAVDASGNLYVADTLNNRILRYPRPMSQPSGSLQLPDMVIGQTSFNTRTTNAGGISATSLSLASASSFVRTGIAFDPAGNLWVTDTLNNRILRYPASGLKTGATADLVIGQPDFTTATATTNPLNKAGLNGPHALAFDPSGKLLVTDALNRLLVFAPPTASNVAAVRIAGIDSSSASTPATQIRLRNPFGVAGTSAGVVVADTGNNRVLLFPPVDSWP
ncbi:MAG TPA: NHL repeat-containing protein, partial [Bryobacteraceae bacterium]|nr:NHL repeat-containing protein [Bryobacteraceae bacterium]